jgi:hypothetical protein
LITQAETLKLGRWPRVSIPPSWRRSHQDRHDLTQAQEHVLRATKAKTDTAAAGYKQQ